MKSRLLLIEGIPGSGKSTTARFVNDWLAGQGLSTHLYLEGQPSHPADPDGMAFLDKEQYRTLLSEQGAFRERIIAYAVPTHGGFLVDYRGMDQENRLPDTLFKTLAAHDVYDSISPDQFMQITLERWQGFAQQAALVEQITVFECCFLQNPFTVLLGQHNCAPDVVARYIFEVTEAIEPLDPRLIYLDPGSVSTVLQSAVETRPQAWIDFVTEYITGQGYGQAHGLEGFEGVVQFYELMKRLIEQTMDRLKIPVLRADISTGDWDNAHAQIEDFLRDSIG